MNIKLNKLDQEKLNNLLETKEINMSIADMFNFLCFNQIKQNEIAASNSFNEKDLIASVFNSLQLNENDKDNIKVANRFLKNSLKHIDINEYVTNDYNKVITAQNIQYKDYKLISITYPAYTYFPLDDIRVDSQDYYREITTIGLSEKEYKFLSLTKGNNIWMCITPNEINTMKMHINKAHGNIVVFGLGLGYMPFMCSNKENINHITIIENDDNIINLFQQYLLNNFPNKNKIEIIHSDAFKFIEDTKLKKYDYAFFDLWHDATDGLPLYIKIKNYNLKCDSSYWIEESLIALFRRCLLTVIEESLLNYDSNDYDDAENEIEDIINKIYKSTKNITITSYDEINRLCSNESIINLLSSKEFR